MSTTETSRPAGHLAAPSPTTPTTPTSLSQDDCPTEVLPVVAHVPVRRSILHAARAAELAARLEPTPFASRRDATPTEELPAVSSDHGRPSLSHASAGRRSRRLRVSTPAKPTGSREARRAPRTAPAGTKGLRRQHPHLARHLRAALAGLLIAAALLTGLQLFAAAGISSARQAALAEQAAQRDAAQTEQSAPTSPAPAEQAEAPAEQWTVEGTTTAAPSPLDLPRCTTSPDTPLPCLATISPSQTRAVVLEEDASLTPLVRR